MSRWTLNLGLAINKNYTLKYQAALRGREHEKENQKERRRMKQPEGKKGKKKKKTQTGIDLEDK